MNTRPFSWFAVIILATLFVAPCFVAPLALVLDGVSERRRVRYELDHNRMAKAGLAFLEAHDGSTAHENILVDDLPIEIASTQPSHVHVANGTLNIEYGGGFGHFGLVISKNNCAREGHDKVAEFVYYYDGD